MNKICFAALAPFFFVLACGETSDPEAPSVASLRRSDQYAHYAMVPLLEIDFGTCSGVALEHGLILTARHCVADSKGAPIAVSSIKARFIGKNGAEKVVGPGDWTKLTFDTNNIDAAYLSYDPAITAGMFNAKLLTLDAPAKPAADARIMHVGFPQMPGTVQRIITEPCVLTSRLGPMPNTSDALQYPGTLQEAICPAWFGDSGGPVFMVDHGDGSDASAPLSMKLLGVTSHTFDVDASGALIEGAVTEDEFGKFGRSLNYAPISQLHSLQELVIEARSAQGEVASNDSVLQPAALDESRNAAR